MKRVFTKWSSLVAMILLVFSSCKKDNDVPVSPLKQALIANTWEVYKVIDRTNELVTVLYERGAPDNQEDYSLVRQQFRKDGGITYVDQFGMHGTDGSYKLHEKERKMEIGLASMGLSTLVQNVQVNASTFSYALKADEENSTEFIFSPLRKH